MNELKKLFCIFAVLALILCGCGTEQTPSDSSLPTVEAPSSEVDTPTSSNKPSTGSSSSKKPQSGSEGSSSAKKPSSSSAASSGTSSVVDTPFNPDAGVTYYYYENLNAEQKRLYGIINDMVYDMKSGMVALGETSARDISLAFNAVRTDHPEYFWMPYSYINKIEGNKFYIAVDYEGDSSSVSYLCTKQQRNQMESALKSKVSQIKKLIKSGMTDYEAELAIHDWLCENVRYVDTGADQMCYTAYGAIVKGQALCEGYARAMQLLCNELSIPCTLVCGVSLERQENHMWNIIKIGGDWYQLDVTWDDDDHNNSVNHRFFNITDSMIADTHRADADFSTLDSSDFGGGTVPSYNFSLPKCTAKVYHYPNVAGCTLDKNSTVAKATVRDIMKQAADEKAPYCEFYLDYDVSDGVDAMALAEKYALQTCKNDVNSNSKHKITGMSVGLTGRTFMVYFTYGG